MNGAASLVQGPDGQQALCEAAPFKTLLNVGRVQAEHQDYLAAAQALHIVDTLLMAERLQPQQEEQALELCSLLSDCDAESVRLASRQTARLCEQDSRERERAKGFTQTQGWLQASLQHPMVQGLAQFAPEARRWMSTDGRTAGLGSR